MNMPDTPEEPMSFDDMVESLTTPAEVGSADEPMAEAAAEGGVVPPAEPPVEPTATEPAQKQRRPRAGKQTTERATEDDTYADLPESTLLEMAAGRAALEAKLAR